MNNIMILESGERSVEVRLEGETAWLTLQQLAERPNETAADTASDGMKCSRKFP